jgi:hypothetical protein
MPPKSRGRPIPAAGNQFRPAATKSGGRRRPSPTATRRSSGDGVAATESGTGADGGRPNRGRGQAAESGTGAAGARAGIEGGRGLSRDGGGSGELGSRIEDEDPGQQRSRTRADLRPGVDRDPPRARSGGGDRDPPRADSRPVTSEQIRSRPGRTRSHDRRRGQTRTGSGGTRPEGARRWRGKGGGGGRTRRQEAEAGGGCGCEKRSNLWL